MSGGYPLLIMGQHGQIGGMSTLKTDLFHFVCGYFVLPKAVTNTGYSMWEITPSQLGTAALTAEKVIRLVAELRSGNFSTEWADLLPPAKDHAILKNWYDACAKLVLPTVEDAIGNLDLNAR